MNNNQRLMDCDPYEVLAIEHFISQDLLLKSKQAEILGLSNEEKRNIFLASSNIQAASNRIKFAKIIIKTILTNVTNKFKSKIPILNSINFDRINTNIQPNEMFILMKNSNKTFDTDNIYIVTIKNMMFDVIGVSIDDLIANNNITNSLLNLKDNLKDQTKETQKEQTSAFLRVDEEKQSELEPDTQLDEAQSYTPIEALPPEINIKNLNFFSDIVDVQKAEVSDVKTNDVSFDPKPFDVEFFDKLANQENEKQDKTKRIESWLESIPSTLNSEIEKQDQTEDIPPISTEREHLNFEIESSKTEKPTEKRKHTESENESVNNSSKKSKMEEQEIEMTETNIDNKSESSDEPFSNINFDDVANTLDVKMSKPPSVAFPISTEKPTRKKKEFNIFKKITNDIGKNLNTIINM